MSKADDLLVEVGTEELPPKALRALMDAFAENLGDGLDEARLARGKLHAFASPRRLAVLVKSVQSRQEDRKISQRGPPVGVAFDDDGNMTAAGFAFAKKCGVRPEELQRTSTDKGEWLSCDVIENGKSIAELMPTIIEVALAALPIPRRMRWGAGDAEFVRPVHWLVLLHGSTVIDAQVFGVAAGNLSRGHRFHGEASLTIGAPADYTAVLEKQGYVIADFERRRTLIVEGVEAAAAEAGGSVVDGEALYDEVTALVEWPVPITGSFHARFLELPREVVISTLTGHQRYFPVANDKGALLPRFITVANIDSKDPKQVREGNERVVLPRLADAAFFWDSDRSKPLLARQDALREVVYQRGLGSLGDKSSRVAAIAGWLAEQLGIDAANLQRAASLAKCDLLTGMVGEFPDLQGTMGRYYAIEDGEPAAVAQAIEEQYLPRHAGGTLPQSIDGRVLALADRLDTLAGIFSIGKKPSGNRDPFGLRRAALGVVRLLVECDLDIDSRAMIATAVAEQPAGKIEKDAVAGQLYTFISERLRRYFLDREDSLQSETFDAVLARHPGSLVDFERRLKAVQAFIDLDAAASLAAANKRIANILRQAGDPEGLAVKKKLLSDDAELELWSALEAARATVTPLLAAREYTAVLTSLAELRVPVDRFFDDVMVMAEDAATRNNRLALLGELRALFLDVADISRLAIA